MRRILLLLLVFATGCAEPPTVDLLIAGGTVIDPANDAPARILDIAIDDGTIVEIGEQLDYRASERIEATGRFVIPGLADMHSHFGNGILAPEEDDTTEVLARHLYYGNTTILNLGSFQAWPERIDELRERLASGELQGPRLLAVGALITRVGSHPTSTIYSPPVQQRIAEIVANAPPTGAIDLTPLRGTTLVRSVDDVRQVVRQVAEWGADAIKITVESGPPEFGVNPRMTPEMIEAAVETARPFGIPVLCHVSMLPELEDCIAQGADGAVHAITPAETPPDDLEARMVAADFVLIPTAAMFEGWSRYTADPGLLDDPFLAETIGERERAWLGSDRMRARMGGEGFAKELDLLRSHLDRFRDRGGALIAGTDTGNPYRFAGHSLHEELAFYVSAGLTEREALATATIAAATLVGQQDRWGSIREGLAADLVILDDDPLESIEHTRTIVEVIRAGRRIDRASLPVR